MGEIYELICDECSKTFDSEDISATREIVAGY